MIGECSGKMRSTPWPNDTLRTVNDARVPPRCRPMTTPSKIWMRSLSPSRTFTCTRTVSPARIAGRSVIWAFSTSSIVLMSELLQNLLLFVIQPCLDQQIRPLVQGPAQRFTFTPPPNLGVVARQQHVGHFQLPFAADRNLGRPRVMRKVEQPPRERIRRHRLVVAHHARNVP